MEEELRNVIQASGGGKIWSQNLIVLAISGFFMSLGMGVQNGVNTNFIQEIGLSGSFDGQ